MRVAPLAVGAVALLAAVVLLIVSLRGLHAAPARAKTMPIAIGPLPEEHPVSVVEAMTDAAAPARDFIGVFIAREATEVAALMPGRLASVLFRIGDRVRAGEVVATLDTRAQGLDLAIARSQEDEALAELDIARSQAAIATDQDSRTRALGASALASGADQAAAAGARRVAELRAASASATLSRHHAAIDRLVRDRDEALVRAPFDGLVVARYVDPGANVTPDRAILRIVRSGEMLVRFALPEERAGQVKLGTPVRAFAPGSDTEVDAIVRRISPEVDAATRWFVVEADVDGSAAEMLVGAAADVFLAEPKGVGP
jgi:RND family efflux transporter MFP subunit